MKDYKPFFLASRVENRILIGLAAITATIIVAGWVAINENARMEEFTERANARSVEAGARIFESNCTGCHGADGRGLPGVGPALNGPHLFSYDFFANIDNEILVVEDRLANSIGDEREAIQAELSTLEAERLVLEETILYDYSDRIVALDAELVALDAEIEMLDGVDNASRLPVYISQREIADLEPLQTEQADLIAKGEPTEEQLEAEAELSDDESAEEPEAAVDEAESDEEAASDDEVTVDEAESDEEETETDEEAADEESEVDEETAAEDESEAALDEAAQEEPVEDEGPTIEDILADYPNLTGAEAERFLEINDLIAAFEEELTPYVDFAADRAALVAERGRFVGLADAHEEVVAARMVLAEAESELADLGEAPEEGDDPDAAEREALLENATDARGDLEDAEIERIEARDALLDGGDILDYDPTEPSRVAQVGWAGSLNDFVKGTLTGGRPTSSSYWPQPMVAWSQVAGGPLRVDQIDNLVDYVLNWDRDFTIEDIRAVQQFPRVPAFGDTASDDALATSNVALVQQGVADRLDAGDIVEGDPALGEAAFANFGCTLCHGEGVGAGPPRVELWARVSGNEEDRLTLTGYEDDPSAYVIQSIVDPSAFVVSGFADAMPKDFADRVGYQDLVHILAYLQTQD